MPSRVLENKEISFFLRVGYCTLYTVFLRRVGTYSMYGTVHILISTAIRYVRLASHTVRTVQYIVYNILYIYTVYTVSLEYHM